MALINFYKGLKENYSPDTHGNSIYSCTDTNECYILGVHYNSIDENIFTITKSDTANEQNAAVYTLLTNKQNILVNYVETDTDTINYPISWANKEGMIGFFIKETLTDGDSDPNFDYYGIQLLSDGTCYVNLIKLKTPTLPLIYSEDNSYANDNKDRVNVADLASIRVRMILVTDMDVSKIYSGIVTSNVSEGLMTIACAEGNNTVTYTLNVVDGTMTKQITVNSYSTTEVDNKIGTNTYTNANYISKETNLTDAAMQLDEEIKATNDNIAILNAASVKSVKVGSNTSNEQFSNGVITIANATSTTDGALSKEDKVKLDNIESTYLPLTGSTITGVVRHAANIDLDNAKYIQAYTTGGQLYPVLFIDSENDFVVGSNGTETRIRSNDSNLVHDTTSGRYTIYDSNNLDITKWNISQLTTSVDNVTSSGLKYYNVSESDVENLPVEDSSYGIVSTFAKLDNNNPGTNNTWGFQLANPNNSDSLWYRDFKGLTKNPWKELAYKEDAKSLVFIQSAGANETNAANYLKIRDGYFNIVVVHNDKYYTPNEINTSNPDSIAISFSTFTTTGYNIYQVIVTANGTCTESLYTSFTIPTV